MDEQSPSGLNPDFNLGHHIDEQKPSPHETGNEAMQAAQAVHNSLTLDAKTGLKTQDRWQRDLAEAIDGLGSSDSLTVYVIDLDKFKAINDKYGHAKGDEALALVAKAAQLTFQRASDVATHGSRDSDAHSIARLGGDEFAIFSVTTAEDRAKNRTTTAEEEANFQSKRLSENFNRLAGDKFADIDGLSLSIGTAQFDRREDTVESIFVKADLAMFEVKYQGRIDRLTPEDKLRLIVIVPFLESIGSRVDEWIKRAIEPPEAA